MEALRLLVNIYKHAPFAGPPGRTTQDEREDLRKHLELDRKHNYATLSQSESVREAVALYLGLKTDADYCAIAEEFVKQAHHFVTAVKHQPDLRLLTISGGGSLKPDDAEW